MPALPLPPIAADIAAAAALRGFGLCAAGQVGWYNGTVDAAYHLPDFGAADRLVVAVGNTHTLWPHFVRAYAASRALQGAAHPLDSWVVGTLAPIFASVPGRTAVRYSHEAPPRMIGFIALAEALRLARRGPFLAIHPEYGPWIALRAAIVIDAPGPPAPAELPRPCDTCPERPCEPAMAAAMAATSTGLRRFLPVREACPIGRAHRYSASQVGYHYDRDRDMLRRR